tara:strand:+ start:124 stop:276 length:153 start_codon:yes stop_codon:yes gene_type:complete
MGKHIGALVQNSKIRMENLMEIEVAILIGVWVNAAVNTIYYVKKWKVNAK